jgi:hypothetical protein
MKYRILSGVLAVLLLSAATAVAAPNVTLRVEGQTQTLLGLTPVTLTGAPEPHTGCPADSIAAVLEVGTNGNWDRQALTQTIMGETHKFDNNDFWGFSILRDGRYQSADEGVCDERVREGDEILAAYNVSDPDFNPTIWPLLIQGIPARVTPGTPFTVTVLEFFCRNQYCASDPDGTHDGQPRPRSGVTVSAGGVSAVTGADGRATLTLAERGPVALRAVRSGNTPSRVEASCVSDGSDGFCGSTVAACATTGDDGRCGTRDRRAPEARIVGIAEQQTFTRAGAPRTLRAEVPADPSGLFAVKLRLSRRYRGACSYYSGKRESFRSTRCGRAFPFKVGEDSTVSYLLPAALAPGRYVLDVIVVDKAFNRDPAARGRNRVVFHVR